MARLLCFAIALLVFAACESDAIVVGSGWWPLQKSEFKNVRELIEKKTHGEIGPIIDALEKLVAGGNSYKANYYKTENVAKSPICFIEFNVLLFNARKRVFVIKGPTCHSHH